jgi:hypothetical protein
MYAVTPSSEVAAAPCAFAVATSDAELGVVGPLADDFVGSFMGGGDCRREGSRGVEILHSLAAMMAKCSALLANIGSREA